MTNEWDWRRHVGAQTRKSGGELTPGKRANTDVFESGAPAPSSGVPGRRSLTESLPDNHGPVQRRATSSSHVDGALAQATAAQGVAGASTPLPFQDTIQRAFGYHDVGHVQAQIGGAAEAASGSLGALAYAQGNRIAFAQSPDLHTAAHEAAHVVQQRGGHAPAGGLDTPGDALEQHADAVADAVVAGDSAASLLDEVADPAHDHQTSAVQRKAYGPGGPSTKALELHLYSNSVRIWQVIKDHFYSVQFPEPHLRLTWVHHDAFVEKTYKQLSTWLDFQPLSHLDEVLHPTNAARTVGPLMPETNAFSLEVAMALAHALHIAVVASIKRLGVRYLEVADSYGLVGQTEITPLQLIKAHPIDTYVAEGICKRAVVTVAPPDPAAAKAAKGKSVGLREVKLKPEGERDRKLWNWVRVTSPVDATAEEVAAAIYEHEGPRYENSASYNAYKLAAAPPLFGVPKQDALAVPALKPYAPKDARIAGDSVDAQLLEIANSGTATDDIALHTAPKPANTANAPAELGKVLEALRDVGLQLTFVQRELEPWALSSHVNGALAFVARKEAELSSADAKTIGDWAHAVDGQKERMTRITAALHALATSAEKLGVTDPGSEQAAPVREILELLAVAAGTSHLAQPSEAKLLQALQLQSGLSVRALQVTERNMMTNLAEVHRQVGDDNKSNRLSSEAVALQQDSRRLQARMLNGGEVDANELEDVSVRSEEVAFESKIYATFDAIRDLNQAAIGAGKGDAAIIASLFSGEFRDLPGLTKYVGEEVRRVHNSWKGTHDQLDKDAKLGGSDRWKQQNRELRRNNLTTAQAQFNEIQSKHKLKEFFENAAKVIENQQFRTAIVKVAAMIGVSIIAGAAAGLAARAMGGMLMQATGATAITDLGVAARGGIALTQIGVDTTISAAGTAAIQDRKFSEVWKENLITALGTSAVFGSISRYAAEQAKIEGRVAQTWAQASKLGKVGMVLKEAGAITAHTLWGAAMGSVAGRIVTGTSQPPPETLRDWALQGVSVAVGRHVSGRIMQRSKMYKMLEDKAENAGRGLVLEANKLKALARRVISGKKPNTALELLNEHDKFLKRELDAIDEAIAKTGDKTGELDAQRDRVKAAVEAAGSEGLLDTKLALIGMEELVPGALWKGTREQIEQAFQQAVKDGKNPRRQQDGTRHKLKIGDRTIEIQEVVSIAKTVKAERILLAGDDADLQLAAKLVVPKPGSIDIIVHGGVDDFIVTINGVDHQISHRSLAKYIKSRGIKFDRVRLLACKAGMHPKGVAQQLANKLGVTVEAPTDKLYIHPDGTLTIGPHETRNTGKWEEFSPKQSESRSTKAPDAKPDGQKSAQQPRPRKPSGPSKRLGPKQMGRDDATDWIASVKEKLTPDEQKHFDELVAKRSAEEIRREYDGDVEAARKAAKEAHAKATSAAPKEATAAPVKAHRAIDPARRTLTPEDVTPGMEIDPTKVNIFRGGSTLEVRPNVDVQFVKGTENLKTGYGLSLDVSAPAMDRFGGAYRIEFIPPELRIVQRGSKRGHFEIMPRSEMTLARYKELVGLIRMTPG